MPRSDANSVEVALLASLEPDLAKEEAGKQADVPGQQVQPGGIVNARPRRELGEIRSYPINQ